MTPRRDPDFLIQAFLAEGQTELPDRAFDAVRLEIHGTRQRVVVGPWRDLRMSNLARIAIAAAAVVLVAVVAVNLTRPGVSGPGGPSPSPSPSALSSPSASPSASGVAYTWPARLMPGTYATSLIWSPDLVFSFTVPEGWDSRDIEVIKGNVMAVQFYIVENVYTDVCGETLADPAITSPEAIADALSGLVTADTAPRPVTVGERSGTYIEFSVGPDFACPLSDVRLIKLPVGVCGDGCGGLGPPWKGLEFGGPQEHNRMWILNVGRGNAVINAVWTPEATPADLAELQAVIDSVRLDTPNATPAPQPESLEP